MKLLVADNRLHDLPTNIGNLKRLESLDARGNEFKLVPVSIGNTVTASATTITTTTCSLILLLSIS